MKSTVNFLLSDRLRAFALVGCVLLAGCEPPLVMEGVEQERSKAVRRSDNFQAMAYNGSAIVAVGARGAVVMSQDLGQTWSRTVLENKPFLMDVAACPDKSFVILDYLRNVWVLEDANDEWQRQSIGSVETPQAVTCDNQGRFWVVGGFSSILRSDDRGQSWSDTMLDRDLYYTTVQFHDADHAVLTGEFGVVTRTSDGGETWEMLEPIPDDFYPQDAWFQNPERGWAVGLNGTIFHTEDGGHSWRGQTTGTNDPIYRIVADSHSLYAVGGNGLILMCNGCAAGGSPAAWQPIEHDLSIRFYLRGATVVNGKLWVAGGAGALHSVTVSDAGG